MNLEKSTAAGFVPTMAEILNLNRARKAKARADGKAAASVKRAAFGRTKAERDAERARIEAEAKRLDGHRRGDD